jgi:hypothetical protein
VPGKGYGLKWLHLGKELYVELGIAKSLRKEICIGERQCVYGRMIVPLEKIAGAVPKSNADWGQRCGWESVP